MNAKYLLAFVAGVAVGVAASYKYFEKLSDERVQQEVESVKAAFDKFKPAKSPDDDISEKHSVKDEKNKLGELEEEYKKYAKAVEDYIPYNKVATIDEMNRATGAVDTDVVAPIGFPELYPDIKLTPTPVIDNSVTIKHLESDVKYISPDQFGYNEAFDECFYTFFTDGIMIEGAIRNEESIVEPASIIGNEDDYRPHIGEYDEDTLIGVNTTLKLYFEVTFVDEPYNTEEKEE